MIDNQIVKRRINDLLYLELNIVNAIHQEIRDTTRGHSSGVIERLKYIIDESNLAYAEKPKERDISEKQRMANENGID